MFVIPGTGPAMTIVGVWRGLAAGPINLYLRPMAKFLLRAVIGALGLWLADILLRGVRIDGVGTLVIAALLLGLVNAFVRPVVTVLTLPLTLVTLGLFLLVVNAMMIGLVALLLGGFHVTGLFAGIGAAIITGVVSWIGQAVVGADKR